jgi:hypothetical protein
MSRRSEQRTTDPAHRGPSTPQPPASTTPTITATAGYLITGVGFSPDHDILVRVSYTDEDISDYLTYRSDPAGCLYAELPTSPHAGALHISATDGRSDPAGPCGLLWSNTHTVPAQGTVNFEPTLIGRCDDPR